MVGVGMSVVGGRPLNAHALVIGPRDGTGASLIELARELGFAEVSRYRGLVDAERQARVTPLLFFLCAAVADVKTLKPVAEAVRFCENAKVKFAPLIYFARTPSAENIRHCIQMGFDDVIALPYATGQLGDRMMRQVECRQIYYQTETYFGPDRRERGRSPDAVGDAGAGQFRRIEIIRRLATGVDVLHDNARVEV